MNVEGNSIEGLTEEVIETGKDAIFEALGLVTPTVIEGDLPDDVASVVKAARPRLEQFQRECKKKSHSRDMLPKLIDFLIGKTNVVPSIRRPDHYGFSTLPKHLAKPEDWTFIDRRILRYIGGPAFYYRQPGHDYYTGYHDDLFGWLGPQLEDEPADGDLFGPIAAALTEAGTGEETLLRASLRELGDAMLRTEGGPTSYGRWLIAHAGDWIETIVEMALDRSGIRNGVVGLFVEHAPEAFATIAPRLLVLEPDEDGKIHAPHAMYERLCTLDPVRYTPLVLDAIAKVEHEPCLACRAELAKVLAERCGPAQRARAFELAIATLAAASERGNKEDRLWFPFAGKYGDGAPSYVRWLLRTFGREAKDAILAFAENTRVFDLEVAEAIARHLGQDGVDALAEGLKMKFDSDDIAPHFRRMFAMLAPLDWSKYHDRAWALARSEYRQVRQTACMALARTGAPDVLQRALELIDERKAHLREAGVLIATLLPGDPAAKRLDELMRTETSDDVRDLIVARRYAENDKVTAAGAAKRVASAKQRGKLAKPVAKWLDERKLGTVAFKGGKKVDADTLRFLLYRQTRRADVGQEPEARAIYALIDRGKSAAAAAKLLALVLSNGGASAKNRFALSVIGSIGGDSVIEPLENLAIDSTNINAVATLGLLGSHEAARALDRIIRKFRIKYPNVREAAQDAFDRIAHGLGITRFELADSMIPDFGFVRGAGSITLGKVKARVVIGPDRKLAFFDEKLGRAGGQEAKPIKNPGKGLTGKHKAALAELRDELDAASRTLRANLEYYMVGGRRWPADKWRKFFLGNPLAFAFARSLIWSAGAARGKPITFRVDAAGKLVDRSGSAVTIAKGMEVSIAHPLELDGPTREAWAAVLAAEKLSPPFAQLERPVFEPSDDVRGKTMSFEFEDRSLVGLTFKSRAERLGWRRGSVVDGGGVSAYRKVFERQQIEAFIGTENLGVASYHDGDVTLGELFFVKAGSVVTGSYTYDEPRDQSDPRLIPLGSLPAIVYSEAIADLQTVTRQASADD